MRFRSNSARLSVALLATAVIGAGLGAGSARAQVSFAGSYTQNFDTLPTTGTTNTFTDNSTLVGWYSSRTILLAGTGTNNAGGLYSFGATSSTERALGSIGSGATDTIRYGVQLQNTSGSVINSLTVSFVGEQWRFGGTSTTTIPAVAQSLSFSYFVAGAVGTNQLTGGSYTDVAALNFTSPVITGPNGGTALDGNADANRVSLSSTITGLNLQTGQYLWLRWTDLNDANNDHALAIDNVTLSATITPPTDGGAAPEPGSLTFLLPLLPVIGLMAHRRRQRRK